MHKSTFIIAIAITTLTILAWALYNVPENEPLWPERIQGFAFSPFQAKQNPNWNKFPSAGDIERDLALLMAGIESLIALVNGETLEPVILTPRECELLEVPPHTTALLTRRITTDASGVVVALGHALLRGDRSRYIYKRIVETPAQRAPRAPIGRGLRPPVQRTPVGTTARRT